MDKAEHIKRVDEFLTGAETFYLATVDGDRPKCRPIGFHMASGGRLYFGVGTFKEVYRQMQKNPHVEICAAVGKEFLRYYGKAVFEADYSIAEEVLSNNPTLQRAYNEQTGHKLGIFHLETAVAEFRTAQGIRESVQFD